MPEIKQQITTGNLIQILAMVVALSIGWAMMDARGQASTDKIADHETRLRALEMQVLTTLTRMDARLGQIENAIAGSRK